MFKLLLMFMLLLMLPLPTKVGFIGLTGSARPLCVEGPRERALNGVIPDPPKLLLEAKQAFIISGLGSKSAGFRFWKKGMLPVECRNGLLLRPVSDAWTAPIVIEPMLLEADREEVAKSACCLKAVISEVLLRTTCLRMELDPLRLEKRRA